MQNNPISIYWNSKLIGVMHNPRVDNFDLYGQWCPIQDEFYTDFFSEFVRGGDVSVIIGENRPTQSGTVQDISESEIEIKIRAS